MFRLIIFFLIFHFHNAHSAFLSGQDLLNYCNSDSPADEMFCLGYIGGIYDEHTDSVEMEFMLKEISEDTDSKFKSCDTGNRTLGQIQDVIVNFIEINPKYRDWTAPSLITKGIDEWLDCGLFRYSKQRYIDDGWKF